MTQPEIVMLVPPSAAKATEAAPMKIDAALARATLPRVILPLKTAGEGVSPDEFTRANPHLKIEMWGTRPDS